MKEIIGFLTSLILVPTWIAGFVLAKGFWSTFSCIFPPWSFYLVVEKLMTFYGLI